MSNIETTVALSLLIHGEAVRFNRGKSQSDDFDFKYMRDTQGHIYPYVSSQCFKKHWRETMAGPYSPITRGKNAAGKEKNQVYTEGNPIEFVDDDLFGYMRAGADNDETNRDALDPDTSAVEQVDAEIASLEFVLDNVRNPIVLLKKFKEKTKEGKSEFYTQLLSRLGGDAITEYNKVGAKDEPSEQLVQALLEVLNHAIASPSESGHILNTKDKKIVDAGKPHSEIIREMFALDFKEALTEKDPTTKRTAPIRMHALIAFSGIKTAKDFQTFARDTVFSGKNAVLNPNPVGIYSGWLKTRILIEGRRIGKFYVGKSNSEITADLLVKLGEAAPRIQQEIDPYTRKQEKVDFVQLSSDAREDRLEQALTGLTDIGNLRGPSSGALHDGSLRPKGFIGAFMRCADSPFDMVWQGTEGLPYLDERRLNAVLLDWEDLFASQKVYIGYPIEMNIDEEAMQKSLDTSPALKNARNHGFTFIVKTPRQAMLQMVSDVKS